MRLSTREEAIVKLIADGRSDKQIGADLQISVNTVPAMAVTGLIWCGLRLGFAIFVRPNLLPPLIRRGISPGNTGDWFIGQAYLDTHGHQWSEAQVDSLLQHLGGGGPNLDITLQQHGISLAAVYQPASRFWTFQAMEAAVFIVLSVVCLGLAAAWVKWRLTRA